MVLYIYLDLSQGRELLRTRPRYHQQNLLCKGQVKRSFIYCKTINLPPEDKSVMKALIERDKTPVVQMENSPAQQL